MAYDIGTARGVIEMEYNGRGIAEAEQDLDALGQKAGKGEAAMAGAAKGMQKAGLVVAGALGVGVYAAANFEQRISAISAVSGATGKDLDDLRNKALQLGKDTAFSASEAASAMEELVKAGLSVDEVLNGAADATVALAAAGEVDMPTAATIASNAMNQFNLAAEDMVNVADKIAGAANASAIDVSDFGMSLQQVGAVANLAGLSFDDTAAAIALMGNAGIKGSDAGTSLKSMLMNLQPTTEKQKELFKDLGLAVGESGNAFFDAEGKTKSLAKIAGTLQGALKGMSKQQKLATLETLFGSDAIRAAAILADSGAKGFNNMGKAMGKVTAAEVAATRMDNFAGSLEEMKGSLETAGIALGTILLPPLRQLVDGITEALNWFLNLSDGMQKFIAIGAVTAAGVLLIVAKLIQFYLWTQKIARALALTRLAFAATWVAALGPIGLIIAAVAAIVAIIIILWKKSETFRSIVLGVWNAIKAAAQAVAEWFMGTLVPWFASVWDAISSKTQSVWNAITGFITAAVNMVVGIVQTALGILRSIWGAIWGTFGPVVKAAWNLITSIINLAWTIIKGIVILNLRLILGTIRAVWNAIRAATSAVWNVIKSIISAVWGAIKSVVTTQINAVKSVMGAIWDAIKSAVSKVWAGIKNTIGDEVTAAVDKVKEIKDRVIGFFADAATWLLNAGREIIQGLLNGITEKLDDLAGLADKAAGIIGKVLPGSPVDEGPLRKLNHGHAGKEIIQMVIDGIEKMATPLAHAMNDVLEPAVPVGPTALPAGLAPRARSAQPGRAPGGLRLVGGELRLDKRGRAYIKGVAQDAVAEADDFDDTIGGV